MNQPQALIEGDLAFPKPRPFDGLPPPFGSRRRAARAAAQREPQPAAPTPAQQAIQAAVQRKPQPAHPGPFPPGVKHILFYKAPLQRIDTHRWDAALEEAKRYLQMGTARPRSSRSDHLLAGAIFAGCTIALTWLLVTCSMKDAEKVKTASVAPVIVAKPAEIVAGKPAASTVAAVAAVASGVSPATHADAAPKTQVAQAVPVSPAEPKQLVQAESVSSVAPAQVAQTAVSPSYSPSKRVAPVSSVDLPERKPGERVAARGQDTPQPERTVKRVKVARLSEAHVNERVALNRAVNPAAKPKVSNQPEWGASAASNAVSADDAPWMNWAAQQRRPAPTMRAAVPVDNNWNDRMTQRRITDNPDAFK